MSESNKCIVELEFHHIIKCISNLIIWKELRHVKVSKVNYTYIHIYNRECALNFRDFVHKTHTHRLLLLKAEPNTAASPMAADAMAKLKIILSFFSADFTTTPSEPAIITADVIPLKIP